MSTVLTVGSGQQYQTVGAAIAAANQVGNDVIIKVVAGTYTNDGGTITASNVVLEGVGGVAKFVGISSGTGSKAALTIAGLNTRLGNLDISGVTAVGTAGVLYTAGTLSLYSVSVHDNQTGVATTDIANGVLYIDTSHIDHNGPAAGGGNTDLASGGGNIDVGVINALTITASTVRSGMGGSEIRSSAQTDSISYSAIADQLGTAAHALDLPIGGKAILLDTEIERGPNSGTNALISWGSAGKVQTGSALNLAGNVILNDVYPNTKATLFDKTPSTLLATDTNFTWNFPSVAAMAAGTVTALQARYAYADFDVSAGYLAPTVASVTGLIDGGVTLRGLGWGVSSMAVSDTVNGVTTLIGTATPDAYGKWSLTSHVKIDQSKIHNYAVSMDQGDGDVLSSKGGLILTDTGADHLVAAAGMADVFAIMSFKSNDIIDGFKTTTATGYSPTHDTLDFSGRGVSSFAQVQALMSGSTSTIFTLGTGKTVTLTGVAPGTLSAGDFAFS